MNHNTCFLDKYDNDNNKNNDNDNNNHHNNNDRDCDDNNDYNNDNDDDDDDNDDNNNNFQRGRGAELITTFVISRMSGVVRLLKIMYWRILTGNVPGQYYIIIMAIVDYELILHHWQYTYMSNDHLNLETDFMI